MAKHDQRILKFLNQNADRAPTITEMMTRLNISISDISDSLGSLQSQGLISKKTDSQGIECWFPTGPQASPQQVPPLQVQASHFSPQAPLSAPMQSQPTQSMRVMQAPEPQPPISKPSPVQVSHIPMVDSAYSPRPAIPPQPPVQEAPRPEPALNIPISNYGLSQPAPKGVGILTLVAGLILATGFSIFMAKRLASQEVKRASNTFVDKKSLLEATTAFKAFEEKTNTHVTALEAEIKQLTVQLASSKAATDSLQTLSAKNAVTGEKDSKGKAAAGKKTAAKAKAKASSGSSALAKAAARGAAKKRKAATAKSSARESSEYSSSSESSSSDSYSSPNVPEPPGLEDLPPPPSE